MKRFYVSGFCTKSAHTIIVFLTVFFLSFHVSADTNWQVDVGDWSDPVNWDNGEPDYGDAVVGNGGVVEITSGVATCSNLRVNDGTVNMSNGSLVAFDMYIGDMGNADFNQSGGYLTFNNHMFIGLNQGFGEYRISGGSVASIQDCSVILGSFNPETWGTGIFTVSGSQANIHIGGSFLLQESCTLNSEIGAGGISPILVDRWINMYGTWNIVDLGDAPIGRFDIMKTTNITDNILAYFKTINLPDGDWDWGIDNETTGDTLWVIHVPEPCTFLILGFGGLALWFKHRRSFY